MSQFCRACCVVKVCISRISLKLVGRDSRVLYKIIASLFPMLERKSLGVPSLYFVLNSVCDILTMPLAYLLVEVGNFGRASEGAALSSTVAKVTKNKGQNLTRECESL